MQRRSHGPADDQELREGARPLRSVRGVRKLTPEGAIFDFALNILNDQEFAGARFSPDGRVLFVNIQGDLTADGPGHLGMTLAIWDPWEKGPL